MFKQEEGFNYFFKISNYNKRHTFSVASLAVRAFLIRELLPQFLQLTND
jgi:hypothetical protein